ncbi:MULTISPECIES: PhzF family phenazine biosynthesis protein [unclassified Bacillus (in: firmicutes)]|uniref:PhzF family phenazine biosynthesis protein n=1 Tax=unclassified Bacillus (in: firmicutes) TaxID=185979 RepID=UPI0008E9E1F5|nr:MULTISPECIES: PhzF family phenazine biosynthesis protein [unclassified Bacillus (in: firmicutes)]SFA90530.1 trans-2,3-dihydro-3-hydroxyanthranilate isomerase [Bacillus sp. UNCCL13]SFQ85290.1 trans-2,3-dihydro-3-hydroxyanthranilate isomerase [Bacillus sp. cl95]
MKTLNYSLLDVFTTIPFGGNQLAVFEEDSTLTTEEMQMIAKELNLSETVFIRPAMDPSKTKNLRIFTPQVELPMAGHPTIGAAFSLAKKGSIEMKLGQNDWTFEEGVGDVQVTVHKNQSEITEVEMNHPNPVFGETFHGIGNIAELLSLTIEDIDTNFPIQTVSTGVPFLFIPVRTLQAMKKINFRTDVWEKFFSDNPQTNHIFTFTTETEIEQSTVHSRMFAPAMGISEDPATGAASGPLGAYLVEHGVIPPTETGTYFIRSEQGMEMGRPSFIDILIRKKGSEYKEVKISGNCVIIGSGQLHLY